MERESQDRVDTDGMKVEKNLGVRGQDLVTSRCSQCDLGQRAMERESQDRVNTDGRKVERNMSQSRWIVLLAVVMFLGGIAVLVVGIVLGVRATEVQKAGCQSSGKKEELITTLSPVPGPTASVSIEGHYRYAAVATDTQICSTVGTDIMGRKGGSVVDAAIATLLCVGAANLMSNGIGGGHFMTIYLRNSSKVYTIIAREMAPAAATENMYIGLKGYNNAVEGGLAIGVPGEVMGIWQAYKLGGSLPWADLFEPTIRLCEEGIPLNLLTNPDTNEYYKVGEKMKRPRYAETLRVLAREGHTSFYNGSLMRKIVKEIRDAGGIVTEDDMKNYFAAVKEPIVLTLRNNMKVYSPPPPSSGVVFHYILNILRGYNFSPYDVMTTEKSILTYHRITEAFKFAYAKRTALGDGDGEDQTFRDNLNSLVENMTSTDFGDHIRSLITDDRTHGSMYYGPTLYNPDDAGTVHMSLLAPNGDAVAITSTINLFYGSKVVGNETGIVYNDEMDDFSTPNTTNSFGVPASPANFIKPHKRPLSSMCPSIAVDRDGHVTLIIGASGGTKITTATALVTMNTLWFNKGIKESIDYPRIHHQLYPQSLRVQRGFPQDIIEGLKKKGHDIDLQTSASCIVQGILQTKEGFISANSDYAKHGIPDGY
ncbi:glutathione hydrolase 1 proenzyme-like [Gigantopelta aegis]|uniref:glutathione hydrolase 1 proenzyme-like n=1 Tax=Gigantopelta aegis TaxID=1735272 RepID=UPI001B887CB7|nr:glutathione hydrolase 1 proenzyme-like [Gigantopelta aegis]